MNCSSCGAENPATTRFCGECGIKLEATALPVATEAERSEPFRPSPLPSTSGNMPAPATTGGLPTHAPEAAPSPAVAPAASSAPSAAAPVINIVNQQSGGGFNPAVMAAMGAGDKSPGVALLLGMLFTGAGQVYNGQILKGVGFLVVSVMLWFMLMGWIVHIVAFIEAYLSAKKMRAQWQLALMGAGQGGGQVARLG